MRFHHIQRLYAVCPSVAALGLFCAGALWAAAKPTLPPVPPLATHANLTSMTANNKLTSTTADARVTSVGVFMVTHKTSDTLGVYSGRPLLAVGDVADVNLTSRTITIKIDRSLCSLPHVLEAQAKQKKVLDKLLNRAFPPERTFFVRRTTTIMDSTRVTTGVRALTSLRERFERSRLQLEDLHPGDRVSVFFRYHENDNPPPAVLNISRQSRDRSDYVADYRPMPVIQRIVDENSLSSQTKAKAKANAQLSTMTRANVPGTTTMTMPQRFLTPRGKWPITPRLPQERRP